MLDRRSPLAEMRITLRSYARTASGYQRFGYAAALTLLALAALQALSPELAPGARPASSLGLGLTLGGLAWVLGFLSRRGDLGWPTMVLATLGAAPAFAEGAGGAPDVLAALGPWLGVAAVASILARSLISLRAWPEMAVAIRLGLTLLLFGRLMEEVAVALGGVAAPSRSLLGSLAFLAPLAVAWLFGFSGGRAERSVAFTGVAAAGAAALLLAYTLWLTSGRVTPLVSLFDLAGNGAVLLSSVAAVVAAGERRAG